jgi:thiosulfate/3-mercaptopyruvate sulfurtransferase
VEVIVEGLPPFVSASWLADHLGDDGLAVVDCRWSLDGSQGRDQYREAHLPGAVFADLDADLAASPSAGEGRHPLPTPEAFAASMGRLGIGDGTVVIACDTAGGAIGARLAWMLRVLDHPAAVLDGGLAAWDGPTEAGDVLPTPAGFTARPWPPEAVATATDVAEAMAGGGLVVDARAPERYRGDREPVDPRPGHVPGAVNLPFADNLGDDGTLVPDTILRDRFVAAGIAPDRDTIVYCGSGVTACHDVLAVELAGLGRPRLFAGSWSAWSSDPDRPAVTGPDPG